MLSKSRDSLESVEGWSSVHYDSKRTLAEVAEDLLRVLLALGLVSKQKDEEFQSNQPIVLVMIHSL